MSNWQKVKIGDFLKRIKRPIKLEKDKNYKLVTIKMHHNGIVLREEKQGSLIKSNMYEVHKGDFILSGIDARNGAFGIIPEALDKAIVTNDFWYFELDENIVNKYFFLELTATSWFDDICKKGSDGTTQRIRLQKDKFFNQEIVLPPLEEQIIFIKKFKQIKSTKEDLESETSIQQSLLKQLKQTILQEAIEGKLTAKYRAKNPDIGTAKELLEQIKIEKEKLIKEKKIKLAKPLAPINEDEIPFDIPPSWEWCRFGDYSINRDGERKPISQIERENRAKIYDYYGASGVIDKIDGYTHDGIFLLIGEDGANLISRTTAIAFIANGKFWVNNHAHVLEFLNIVSLSYVEKYINAINLKPYVTGGFQPKLSQANLNNILMSIPPLEEQKEIVATIEKLFAICDELESEINQNKSTVDNLMATVLKEAFEQ